MSNTAFRDRIKIGQSERDPSSFRKNELYSTGTPEPFKVEYTAFVENYKEVEKKIHRIFDKQRPNKDREFFNVSISEAILAIRENSKVKYDEVFYKSPQEILKEEIRREEARKRQKEKIEKELEEKSKQKERDDELKKIENERLFAQKQERKKEMEPMINLGKFIFIYAPLSFIICGIFIYIIGNIVSFIS